MTLYESLKCKHKSHIHRVPGSIPIGGKLLLEFIFVHYEAMQKCQYCQLCVIMEKHQWIRKHLLYTDILIY